jgi:uncharacterized protein with HEPN domain
VTAAEPPFDRTGKALDDIIRFSEIAAGLVARGRDAYDTDEVNRLAAESILHKIGEVIARLGRNDPDLLVAHPEINWRPMKGMRDKIAHDYDVVDYDLLWNALASRLPQEADGVRALIEQRRRANG